MLDVGDAVDLSRRVGLYLGTNPELLKQLGTLRRQAVVPLEAACRRRGAELVDQPMVVKQAQPAPGGRGVSTPPEQRQLARGEVVDVMQQLKQAAVALGDRDRL